MSDRPKREAEAPTEVLKQSLRNTIEQMSVPEITALIEFGQQTRLHKQEAAREALVTELRDRAATLGFSLEDLVAQSGKPSRPATKAKTGQDKLPAKYRGPSGEKWSGRGRTPTWLTALEAEGRKREEFAA
jgi:DNA-binding protein H-NS